MRAQDILRLRPVLRQMLQRKLADFVECTEDIGSAVAFLAVAEETTRFPEIDHVAWRRVLRYFTHGVGGRGTVIKHGPGLRAVVHRITPCVNDGTTVFEQE